MCHNLQIERLSFNDQIALFQQSVVQLVVMLGRPAANDLLHNSLFAVVMGGNDYGNNYLLTGNNSTRTMYTPSQFVQLLMSTYRTQLTVQITGYFSFLNSIISSISSICISQGRNDPSPKATLTNDVTASGRIILIEH